MNQEKIGKFISNCRKEKNITQSELAEKLNVTNRTVSRWENGKNMPDYSILKDLCNILEIDVNEFINGERLSKEDKNNNDDIDLILKEYYKMKKQKDKLRTIIIVGVIVLIQIILVVGTYLFLTVGFDNRLHITTNKTEYNSVIGSTSKGRYKDKWGMSEEIFPKSIKELNVLDFKMINESFIDDQYLSYLVVDYDESSYKKEIERLNKIGIEKYNYYEVTGFTNYELIAMDSDEYYGFVYAITDGKSKIIYVEIIFTDYTMSIDYENEIPKEYLPDGFNAKEDNEYRKKMFKEGK